MHLFFRANQNQLPKYAHLVNRKPVLLFMVMANALMRSCSVYTGFLLPTKSQPSFWHVLILICFVYCLIEQVCNKIKVSIKGRQWVDIIYIVMSLSGNFLSLIKKRQLNLILVVFFSEFQHHKITKLRLSKSQLTSNVLNSFIPSFKNLTYLDLRSNSLTTYHIVESIVHRVLF